MDTPTTPQRQLEVENAELRARLEEAEDTLAAIRSGDVDAIVVGSDIYTLESADAASNRLRKDVLSQMEDAVLACDSDDHVIFMNPAAERQYRKPVSSVLGHPRTELFHETWHDLTAEHLFHHDLSAHGTGRAHSVHTLDDGSSIHVESTVSRLRDSAGQTIGYLSVVRDVSGRVRAEETLLAATQALAASERKFSTLVENSPDVFARMDRQHRHRYVSPVITRYSGLTPEQYLGKTSAELGMPEPLLTEWQQALDEVFSSGRVGHIRFRYTMVNGEECVFHTRLMPEFAEDGSVESVLSIAADITEQALVDEALRESQARLAFTLDSAQIGDWDMDLDRDVFHHSLGHDRCFGYDTPIERWDHEIFLSHVHRDDRVRVRKAFRDSIAKGKDLHFECRVVWPDQTVHWIEAHGSLYGDKNTSRRMLGIVFDSTVRKVAEEALHDADRRKDEFLATLAHELRNPLAPIRNALEIMRLSADAGIQEKARSIIDRQLQQMVHLVDDLLDVSRISRGKVELRRERADVASVVQASIETSRPLIEGGRHELTTRVPAPRTLMVDADVTRLTQIISNLLNNSAKYTPEGGQIEVSAYREGAQVVIAVTDSGVGISNDMLPRVFDMFAQVDRSLDRAQGGLGIGLALVKRLVELHGGSVEAHSDGAGCGSRFVVRLPLATSIGDAFEAGVPHGLQAGPTSGRRVLVVDDNVDSALSLAEILGILGYETFTAHDGVVALYAAEHHQPHVVLLDLGLPKMSGLDVARNIRQSAWGKDMLLIALSGWGQDEDRRQSNAAGFDHHFVKPVDIEVLSGLLAEISPRGGGASGL